VSRTKWPQHLCDKAELGLEVFQRDDFQRTKFNGNWHYSGTILTYPPLDPLAVFEEIMKRMPQLDIQNRSRDNLHRKGPENLI